MDPITIKQLGQERMQQFIDEAEAYRKERRFGAERKSDFLLQIRTFLVKTFTLTIR